LVQPGSTAFSLQEILPPNESQRYNLIGLYIEELIRITSILCLYYTHVWRLFVRYAAWTPRSPKMLQGYEGLSYEERLIRGLTTL